MLYKVIWWLGFTLTGAILYRLGGKQGFDTKFRDIGIPCLFLGYLGQLGAIKGLWVGISSLIPCFFGLFGALTTYKYFLPKPKDYLWYHYVLHGFFTAFSAIFFAWASGHWLGFWIRCAFNTVFIALWSHYVGWDDLEEGGRGASIIGTTPLLLI